MYINGLGTRNVENFQTAGSSNKTSNVNSFEDNMQKAIKTWKTMTNSDADSSSSDSGEEACCEQCSINSRLIDRLMMQSMFMRNGLSGMNMSGLSLYGSYGLGNSMLSNIL